MSVREDEWPPGRVRSRAGREEGREMTPRLRANRAIHGIGVDNCEMRERLPPHRDCVQCRMVEDTVLDAVETAHAAALDEAVAVVLDYGGHTSICEAIARRIEALK